MHVGGALVGEVTVDWELRHMADDLRVHHEEVSLVEQGLEGLAGDGALLLQVVNACRDHIERSALDVLCEERDNHVYERVVQAKSLEQKPELRITMYGYNNNNNKS